MEEKKLLKKFLKLKKEENRKINEKILVQLFNYMLRQ